MKELENMDSVIDDVTNCNLDDDVKKYVLRVLQKRLFELRNEESKIKKNIEIYKAK